MEQSMDWEIDAVEYGCLRKEDTGRGGSYVA
jgi:hypothetical protein